jgi:GT2 family glycosyltransferase
MEEWPKVSIIVLNWNNYADTKECLESLGKISYPNYEIIVVDNGSQDGSTARIQKEFSQHIYLYNKSNLGFTGGNNVGMRYAIEKGSDYIFWINNDMIVDKGFLEPLMEAGEKGAELVGPVTYYYNEREKVYSAGEDLNFFRTGLKRYKIEGKPREVDSLGGAFLIKKEVIDKIGYFYEPYFLNCEETDYCFQARKAGFKVFFEPKSKIWHKVGTTLRKIPAQATYYYYRNKLLFIKRNYFYLRYLLYLYWNLYLVLRFIEKSLKKDKKIAFAIKNALIDFWSGNFGKKDLNV